MLRSMTGFGRSEIIRDGRKYTVEIRTVNHRYLEIGMRMPKALSSAEVRLRSVLKEYLERGKTDVFLSFEDLGGKSETVRYNQGIARQYYEHLLKMSSEFGLDNDIRLSHLSRYPDVFTLEDAKLDVEEASRDLEECVREACREVVHARETEGENLKRDLLKKLDEMDASVAEIEKRAPAVVEEYRNKLKDRIRELLEGAEIDEARIVTEVTIFADKTSVDEEIVRLKSHIGTMRKILEEGGSVGRRLDFIAQEMNREANTTLSKVTDLTLSDTAIDLKTGIEKIREQIQNIE